jgi:ABC-type polysaccharide/polyol phosphate export permease
MLAMQDIKLRYRRSALGPFWITISMATVIYTMGFLYGYLFHAKISEYFPFLSAGLITWSFISLVANEVPNSFVESHGFVLNYPLPFSVYVMKIIARNFIIFLHNIVVFIPVAIYFDVAVNWNIFWLIPGLAALVFVGVTLGIVLATLGTRYRDIPQLIASLTQMGFYLTPIMWQPKLIPAKYALFYKLNPAYQFVELIRAPLLGKPISLETWEMVGIVAVVSFALCCLVLLKFRNRIAFWI